MHAMKLGAGHYCDYCEEYYTGTCHEKTVTCCDHSAGTDIDDVCTTTEFQCYVGCSSTDADMIYDVETLWMCGDCSSRYMDRIDAIQCCK